MIAKTALLPVRLILVPVQLLQVPLSENCIQDHTPHNTDAHQQCDRSKATGRHFRSRKMDPHLFRCSVCHLCFIM